MRSYKLVGEMIADAMKKVGNEGPMPALLAAAGIPASPNENRNNHGERLTLNQRVQGSSPCAPTIDINDLAEVW
jgi:hypothetical protein